ncbi:putative regulatory protein [Mycolicibacterium insubricum]|uniref:Uncharacterized protein n=1 Tax=Mycolicibacterium insubricum TaxID=444597 RepID=A0A1X0D7N6_9MYCO|nr:PucR family transcriptional regulator [Mycolicibacterium insubricum]ORA67750.1 hypothetical protein BST26_15235 [Mycolicibacterium insubricum]BBZ68842.1 putative regulatory protein [Mycolicibacterium insubricum]
MTVPVRWLLGRRALGLDLRAGHAGVSAPIGVVTTTELTDPTPWLSGGELVLTTGIGLPEDDDGRRAYLYRLADAGVAALGFGVGVRMPATPRALIDAADERGLALFDVPLPTPFVALVQAVVNESARQQSQSSTHARNVQQRMTRAAVSGGPDATLRALASGCAGIAVLADRHGRINPPILDPAVQALVFDQIRRNPGSSAVESVGPGAIVTQPIRVGHTGHGWLAVVFEHPPQPTDHILIGHANSLLALDFEKPLRLRTAQHRLNAAALGVLLAADADLGPAQQLVAEAADNTGIRALVLCADTSAALAEPLHQALQAAGRPVFVHTEATQATVVLRGGDGTGFAARLLDGLPSGLRRHTRAGLSTPAPVAQLAGAVAEARRSAAAAPPGGEVLDAARMAGRTLLEDPATRAALGQLAGTLIAPLHDADPALVTSLRAFLEHHGHWEAAATAAGVHRHTLRARLARIEELLGVDLGSARVRAELLLALLADG